MPTAQATRQQAADLLEQAFGASHNIIRLDAVPGRVNLIGEHIDYHLLPVLPMAIDREVAIAYRTNGFRNVRAISAFGERRIEVALGSQTPGAAGEWGNYVRAAVEAVCKHWEIDRGLDAAIASDLPVAAGLSSSSALMTALVIALLRVNLIEPTIAELMEILPEAEYFVGTRGGGMDHAAVIASRADCALHIRFAPLELSAVPIPSTWRFLVAHSLSSAEKSGALREKYNRLKEAGLRELARRNLFSFRSVPGGESPSASGDASDRLVFEHVVEESARVDLAIAALLQDDLQSFGRVLLESHVSLRDKLRISTPAIDSLVKIAMESGAAGARLTGAGFGGCVIVICDAESAEGVRSRMQDRYYANQAGFDAWQHLFFAEPSPGALIER